MTIQADITRIDIANKLWINEGGKIMVPGCEPVSELTSENLATQLRACGGSEISARKALELIPGSRIEISTFSPSMRYFVLPSGPPPDGNVCPKVCIEDWYALLRGEVEPEPEQPDEADGCDDPFYFGWCPNPNPNPELRDGIDL
jgi:hypothetical protein